MFMLMKTPQCVIADRVNPSACAQRFNKKSHRSDLTSKRGSNTSKQQSSMLQIFIVTMFIVLCSIRNCEASHDFCEEKTLEKRVYDTNEWPSPDEELDELLKERDALLEEKENTVEVQQLIKYRYDLKAKTYNINERELVIRALKEEIECLEVELEELGADLLVYKVVNVSASGEKLGAVVKQKHDTKSSEVGRLKHGDIAIIERFEGRRAYVVSPNAGWLSIIGSTGVRIMQYVGPFREAAEGSESMQPASPDFPDSPRSPRPVPEAARNGRRRSRSPARSHSRTPSPQRSFSPPRNARGVMERIRMIPQHESVRYSPRSPRNTFPRASRKRSVEPRPETPTTPQSLPSDYEPVTPVPGSCHRSRTPSPLNLPPNRDLMDSARSDTTNWQPASPTHAPRTDSRFGSPRNSLDGGGEWQQRMDLVRIKERLNALNKKGGDRFDREKDHITIRPIESGLPESVPQDQGGRVPQGSEWYSDKNLEWHYAEKNIVTEASRDRHLTNEEPDMIGALNERNWIPHGFGGDPNVIQETMANDLIQRNKSPESVQDDELVDIIARQKAIWEDIRSKNMEFSRGENDFARMVARCNSPGGMLSETKLRDVQKYISTISKILSYDWLHNFGEAKHDKFATLVKVIRPRLQASNDADGDFKVFDRLYNRINHYVFGAKPKYYTIEEVAKECFGVEI